MEANEVTQVKLSIAQDSPGIDLTMDTATVTIIDDDGQFIALYRHFSLLMYFCSLTEAVIHFDPQNITVSESKGRVVFRIVKTGLAAIPLTVVLSTTDLESTGSVIIMG